MLVLKENPKGIDAEINRIQRLMYATLSWDNYESYHRAYKNERDGLIIPEVYIGNNEYREVLFDDTFTVTSFFIEDGEKRQIDDELWEQDVAWIFQGDMKKLFPDIAHRPDEEFQNAVLFALAKNQMSDIITGVESTVENVYRGLRITGNILDRVRLTDMSNYHVFRIDMKLRFMYCCVETETVQLVLPITVTDTDGEVYELSQGDNFTCTAPSDAIITNSVGDVKYSVPPGATQAIPKHTIFQSDGSTVVAQREFDENYTTPAVTINDGAVVISKEAGQGYTCSRDTFMNFVFGIGATPDYTVTIASGEEGTFASANITNMTSVVYKKNGNVVTLPFTLSIGDTLQTTGTITNTSLEARVKLSGTY